ncbi:MAG TPA: PQQ-binding-like beta-propeller repeat protein [Streptosporangiaceae bacterium]|nr:PQQ-binding-like beta-propeller repeat protein [Streptosporangiaceae bacterium]
MALSAIGGGSAPADASVPLAAAGSWTVYHHDLAGDGVAPPVSAVHTATSVWTSPALDGQIYGEPLVSAGLVYVATENDTVYALSAATGAVAWSAHLGSPVPAGSLPCGNITPTVGITGTPVIDQARGEIFVVADVLAGGKPAHRLVGLATASGRIEMTRDVDPPGADAAALLQRTGLTLDDGRVVFGFGGNYGDCASYRGRVAAVPETSGTPGYFTVDAASGESEGAVWMGGAAPVVDGHGDIWVTTGNGSVRSDQHAYDDSDSVLELSPSLQLVQFFAPSTWAADNSRDLDMSIAPALLPDGQVLLAGKARIIYLLSGAHLGGIGHQQATLGPVCGDDIDGGGAVVGMTVYLPCLAGIIAVRATRSPPALHLLWSSGTGGGPPIEAAGLVWTMGQNGTLYGLDPATGRTRQQVTIGAPASHFPTPSVGDGLLLAASAEHVVAFAAPAPGAAPATPGSAPQAGGQAQAAPGHTPSYLAAIVVVAAAVLVAIGWLVARRLRRRATRGEGQ